MENVRSHLASSPDSLSFASCLYPDARSMFLDLAKAEHSKYLLLDSCYMTIDGVQNKSGGTDVGANL